MNRRAFIAAAGAGSAALLAGCIGDDGDESGTPDGEWELRARIENTDDQPRDWRVEARSGNGNVAAAYSTLPAGETTDVGLMGMRRGEDIEVYAESDNGAQSQPWDPSECRRLFADVTISGGEPAVDTECREE
ncbi:hypothetical protein HWV23_11870 [Natronomonas halophila]|uniref:hypothetical protein n=1 Tax=Natronomonas halophila TaxID=2747817 RepID=UPI0015B57932|nr:hypothetical protein [Natronomonas halophila]QLD86392.1 hypothetical protein HWV23_11870 [Natronomonas halophila]